MDHGEGSGAARGSEKRKCHRGREDFGSTSEEEWSTDKVGVTVLDFGFPRFFQRSRTLFHLSHVPVRPRADRYPRSPTKRTRSLSMRPKIVVYLSSVPHEFLSRDDPVLPREP